MKQQPTIELNSSEINAYLKLANSCKNAKDYKNALLYLKKAIKVDNKCYICYHQMADVYDKLNKYEQSLFYLQKAIKLNPDFYDALFSMAQCYRKMQNENKMVEYLHKTLKKLPKHPGANHLLASLNQETNSKYSSEYAEDLFDRYADHFENHLINSLKYQVPTIIKEKLQSLNPPRDSKVLDLGCGTGLLGKAIIDIFPNLVGVDISTNMIEETRKKNIYTTLYIDDIQDFLFKNVKKFDLVMAADVFIYIGDLQVIFSSVKKCLSSHGYFIFSIELSSDINTSDHKLAKSGRFSHTVEYIESLCKEIGFDVEDKEEVILRQENNTGQKGAIFILKLPPF
ncbi:methyltransferase domain-containing protein [Sulfurimonas sp.]|uniref:methyltransferase domain-containing protein n=1 Tax=Sulfurimonas sp. TaxID=2022749 RepID=UPI003D13836F